MMNTDSRFERGLALGILHALGVELEPGDVPPFDIEGEVALIHAKESRLSRSRRNEVLLAHEKIKLQKQKNDSSNE